MKKIILVPFLIFAILCATAPKNSYYAYRPIRKNIHESEKKVMKLEPFECPKSTDMKQFNNESLCLAISELIYDTFIHFGTFIAITPEMRKKAVQEYALSLKMGSNRKIKNIDQAVISDYFMIGKFSFASNDTLFININVGDQSGAIRAKSSGTVKIVSSLSKDSGMAAVKKISIEILYQLGYNLTEQEISLIESSFETNNLEASIANYKGENQLKSAENILLISEEARKSNISPEIVKQATGEDIEQKAVHAKTKELKQQAKSNFEKALQLDPDYIRAKENLRNLISLLPPTF